MLSFFLCLFFGTNVTKINNWNWFSQITSLPVILWYLSPVSQDVQYHHRSCCKTRNTAFLRQYLGMHDMDFFQPLLLTDNLLLLMSKTNKITNDFPSLYSKKTFKLWSLAHMRIWSAKMWWTKIYMCVSGYTNTKYIHHMHYTFP